MKILRLGVAVLALAAGAACRSTTAPDPVAPERARMEAGINGLGGGYTEGGTVGTGHLSSTEASGDSTALVRGVNGLGGG